MKNYLTTDCPTGFYVIQDGPFAGDLVHIGPKGIQAFNPETGRKSWAVLCSKITRRDLAAHTVVPVVLSYRPDVRIVKPKKPEKS